MVDEFLIITYKMRLFYPYAYTFLNKLFFNRKITNYYKAQVKKI